MMISCFPKTLWSVGALMLLVLASPRAAESGGPVDLKPKWVVGQRQLHRVIMHQDQDISGAAMPGPMKQSTRQVQEMAITAKQARPGGGHELEVEYTRMQMESKMGDMTVLAFDSAKPASEDGENPAAGVFRALVGARFRLLTDARGQVASVEGVKELIQKLSGNLPPMFTGMLEGMVNEESLKQMGGTMQGLPEKPVKVGDNWPVKQEVALGPMGKLGIDMTMTFKGWESRQGRNCAVLEHTGTMKSVGEPGPDAPMAITSLSGTTQGKSWFDVDAGVAREGVTEQKIEMKLRAMGQELSTKMTQLITNQLVEITGGSK